jgi:nucleotide-binding universal stress UspA family protein
MKPVAESKMVVPWDFSEMSEHALQVARSMVNDTNQLQVIHIDTLVIPAGDPGSIYGVVSQDTQRDNLVKAFRERVAGTELADVSFEVRFGDPGSEITKYASQVGADLLVISSHGRTGISRLLIGSVAERVVRLSPCPVLVLRNDEDPV